MQLILLGTGCPKVDHKRFGPSNLVSTRKTSILIDCGSGVTQRLKEAKFPLANINALFLTHLHSDHIVDIGPFAGKHGGEIIFSGNKRELLNCDSLTAQYINNKRKISVPKNHRLGNGKYIELKGCRVII